MGAYDDAVGEVKWQVVYSDAAHVMRRSRVPGGWFVQVGVGGDVAVFFYPDAKHEWDGSSIK